MGWQDFRAPGNHQEALALSQILALPEDEQELLIGELIALRDLAALGGIGADDETRLKPIRVDPDIYELKWSFRGLLFRQYHGEPDEFSDKLIDLHFHEKDVSSRDDHTINRLQDIEISQAYLRYVGGRHSNWGL